MRAGRRSVGEAAARVGARAVAMGLPVLADERPDVTPDDRYRRIHGEYGELADQALACAMPGHVDVAGDAEAGAVADRGRPRRRARASRRRARCGRASPAVR